MTMTKYHMRDLISLSADELWMLPEERHVIIFDDGEITTHTRATILSTYFCYPLTVYTEAPLLKRFHLGENIITSKLILSRLNDVIWSIHAHYNEDVDCEHLAKLAIQATNRLYNDATIKAASSVASLSILDVVEIMDHPVVKKANEEVQPNQHSIEKKCYPAIKGVLMDDTSLRGNVLKEAARAGTLKLGQAMQIVGPIGYQTDINSDILPEPLTKGFAEGIPDLYGLMVESRSGAKSLLYNKELLKETEYFNRKTQLVAQYVQRLHRKADCGTPHFVNYAVTKDSFRYLHGKYYLKEDNTQDWIRGHEEHLIGTTVKMRSVLGCINPDPAGVCDKCYGRLSFSIPNGTNVGHVSAVIMGDAITSSVLSTKHHAASSNVEKFHLPAKEQQYLRYGEEEETLYLHKRFKDMKVTVTVARAEVANLADVLMIPAIEEYPITSASHITQIMISVDHGDGAIESDVLKVSLYNRHSSFSREVLQYIRHAKWSHDVAGDVKIDLSGFDQSLPFLKLPYKHINMYSIMTKIKGFLHSGTDTSNKKLGGKHRIQRGQRNFLKNYTDPVEALHVFASMLNEKLSINIVHCEILLYAMMVVNSQQRDYRLPIPGINGQFEKYNTLVMYGRSLSAAMAYEKQDKPLVAPGTFINRPSSDHPYDLTLTGGLIN